MEQKAKKKKKDDEIQLGKEIKKTREKHEHRESKLRPAAKENSLFNS